ncbi:MAG TPA: translocation/assembly module TamB domain-containing protein [Bryobacteraceae bacterium]|nr:translocation/assembly module TamB domain-containing protein [Bryobacteraceae bacterium]
MTARRLVATTAASAAALAAGLAVAGALVLRSDWFREQVRRKIVDAASTATGGRVELGSVTFDWRRLHVEARRFTIHGSEPSGKPPLFQAAAIALDLKIVSLFERKVDLAALDATQPRVYLIVAADGSTNVPEPKVKRPAKGALDTILDLAVGRFRLRDGLFEVENRQSVPFDLQGRGLGVNLAYERAAKRYRGALHVTPLDLNVAGYAPTALDVAAEVSMQKDRVDISEATLRSGASELRLNGALENMAAPRAALDYQLQASQADIARFLKTRLLESGSAQVAGHASWSSAGGFSVTGVLHASDLEYRDEYVRLRRFRAEGGIYAGPAGIDVTDLRLSGVYSPSSGDVPADIRVDRAAVRGADIRFTGLTVSALGGVFDGGALLRRLDRFQVNGAIAGFEARRVVAVYSAHALPWDGRASGPLAMEGSFSKSGDLQVSTSLEIDPETGGAPVRGRVAASYDAASGVLDLGRSALSLPSSRLDFSGALGRELRIHLETRDLGDLLPAVGADPASVPVKLADAAVFDGSVSGRLDDPYVSGHLALSRFSCAGRAFDSLTADVAANSANLRLENAALASGAVRAQFQGALALDRWSAGAASDIYGSAALRNADLRQIATLAGWSGSAAGGSVDASAQVSGTLRSPIVQSDVTVSRGAFQGEPFDRLTAHVNYTARLLEISNGAVAARAKQMTFSASYAPGPGGFASGHLKVRASTNPMPLEQIRTLAESRPGIAGTARATLAAELDVRAARPGERPFAITSLQADIAAQNLRLTEQTFGDVHLTAATSGGTVRAHLDSDFAGSAVKGDGSWRLGGDDPGSATVDFSGLDFLRVREWLAPAEEAAPLYAGSAEGQLRIDAALMQPAALKAELRIAKFELAPAPGSAPARAAQPLTVHNDGPMVVSYANRTATVESAHLQGRGTDVTITGKAALSATSPADLRVNGRVDLGILQAYAPDLTAAGSLAVSATVRGPLNALQIGGRAEVQDASVSVGDFPNGLSHASGVILFAGNRVNIQSLSGETGGGRLDITGFAGETAGETVFQLHLTATGVRLRYPAGVSTVANAGLNLAGSVTRSLLSGTVTVLRTSFNTDADFSSVLASSTAPVQAPTATGGVLDGLNFDVQIQTAPDVQVESSLTQDVGMEATLRLKGTVSNPGLQGRINVTQGQLMFFGTRYSINQGTIAFYNQARIEPLIDVDLETKAKGIDVTLNVSGTPGKLNLTPRSDPPLQFSEIVAFLATGAAPTTDPTLLTESSTAPQSWQQMGASALLGQAIASPVTGRLQRFFGVSRLRIDPTLPGVENNPQARVTLEQQVTPAITLTYITVINNSNPQVISVEWDFGKQWSVTALREENGVFGIDFFVKRRLK